MCVAIGCGRSCCCDRNSWYGRRAAASGHRSAMSPPSQGAHARKAPSARNRVTTAHSGKDFPKRVQNAIHGCFDRFKILLVDPFAEEFLLGSRVFAVRVDVHTEIFILLRVSEAVMLFQSINFGFADRRDLTFVCVKRRQSFSG